VNKKTCSRCEEGLEDSAKFSYGDDILCENCFDEAPDTPQKCPACGRMIDKETESVGLLLTPRGSTAQQKKDAVDVLVIVCPYCRVLFFDNYHYKVMEGLKKQV